MNPSDAMKAMSESVQRLSATMRTSSEEVRAMRHKIAVMRWLDVNDPETPRWWQ